MDKDLIGRPLEPAEVARIEDLVNGAVLDNTEIVTEVKSMDEAKAAGDKTLAVWGSGNPRREFMHVDDLADACVFLMRHYDGEEHVNVGTGEDLSIRELATLVRDLVAPGLRLEFDASKPDGMPRKLLDVGKLHALGWRHRIELRDGIEATYAWYRANAAAEAPLPVRSRD